MFVTCPIKLADAAVKLKWKAQTRCFKTPRSWELDRRYQLFSPGRTLAEFLGLIHLLTMTL